MALTEQEEFELLSLERERALGGNKYDPSVGTGRYLLNRAQQGAAGLLALPAEVVYQGGQLLRRGLSNIPGYTDVVPEVPIQSPAALARRVFSDASMKAPSRATEIAGGVAEFAGSGILPSIGIVSRAAQKVPAALAEIGSTVLGGAGSEVGGLPGAVIGSVVGAQSPTLYSKAASIVGGAVPWLKAQQAAVAPKELSNAIESFPQSAQNIEMAGKISQNLADIGAPGFRPTLGGQTGAPGILAREAQIAGSSAEDLSQYTARQSQNRGVVEQATDIAFPAGSGDLRRSADVIKRATTQQLESRLNDIQRQQQDLARIFETRPQQEIGARLNQLRDEANAVARGIKNAKLTDVYQTADRLGISENMDDVVQSIRSIMGADVNAFQQMPPVFQKILTQYAPKQTELAGRSIPPDLMAFQAQKNAPKPATFQELHSLWREANSQFGSAVRSGDAQAQYYLQQVKDALKGKLAKFEQGGFGELTDKFKDFNAFYATKYAPAFKQGVGGKMGATNRYGELLKEEDIVSRFFTPSGIDDFNIVYGGDRNAQQALADGVVGLFRQAAVKGGKIDQKAAQNFIRNNAETLDKLPDIRAILSNRTAANEALLEQSARVRQNISDFNKSTIAKIAKTDNVDALIDKALTDRRPMMQLVALSAAGGDSTRKALARTIAERIPIAAQKAKLDPLSFVTQNESLLRPALDRLGKDHFTNLKTIAGAQTIIGRTDIPTQISAPRIKDFLEETIGTSMPSMVSQMRATTVTRQSSPVYMLTNALSKFGIKLRQQNTDELMREAIYNPEIAASWAQLAKGKPFTMKQANSFMEHLSSAGLRIAATDEEGQ